MQTAMQKLIEELLYHLAYDDDFTEESRNTLEKVVDKCKGKLEMEKQQIIDAFDNGYSNGYDDAQGDGAIFEEGKDYFAETYGSKGSDEHIVEANEMISSQTEISDEEINDAAYKYAEVYQCPTEIKMCKHDAVSAWIQGIKWYREQLKKKQ